MSICKRMKRGCKYPYNQNNQNYYPCNECIEKNLEQPPITCVDCQYAWGCEKRGKFQRRMKPCENFAWD